MPFESIGVAKNPQCPRTKAVARRTNHLPEELYAYLLQVSVREPPIMTRLRDETASLEKARMQIGPDQGQFMALLVQLMGARNALEVGTFTGYSALAVALALPDDGRLIACDVSEEWTSIGRRYWEEAGVAHKIELRLAPAVETLDGLLEEGRAGTFDFVFIDAEKTGYQRYYEWAVNNAHPGSVIVAHNAFRGGGVVCPSGADQGTDAMRDFTARVAADSRVTATIYPGGDGMVVAVVN